MKSVCQEVGGGLHGLLAWQPQNLLQLLASTASYLTLPIIIVDSSTKAGHLLDTPVFALNLAPDPATVGHALSALIDGLDMDSFLLVSNGPDNLLLLKDLVNNLGFFASGTRYLEISSDLVSQLSAAAQRGQTNFLLLSCSSPSVGTDFLEAALLAGVLQAGNKVILPCLGLHSADLAKYRYLGAAIILLMLSDTSNKDVDFDKGLLVDALTTLEEGLRGLQPWPVRPASEEDLRCWGVNAWEAGASVAERARQANFVGLTGAVRFDEFGQRSKLSLSIVEISETGEDLRGVWSTERGLLLDSGPRTDNPLPLLQSKEVIVVATTLSEPYTMLKKDADSANRDGNDRYEGFAVDLTAEIARIVGINCTLSIVAGYGSRGEDGSWTGMVGEILEGRADMAIADLTINSDRERVVDFSMPFLELGISILFVASPSKSIDLFSFMAPFSPAVWLLMLAGGVAVSLGLFLISRNSPFETAELDSADGDSPFLSFNHCLWFSVASWMQQGCDFLPRAVSTRTLASVWWFFTLIIISSYTANLAAFLTIERMELPISSVKDLVTSKIKYGALQTGSTLSFFKESDNPLYRKVWRSMEGFEDVLVQSNTEGVEKVIMERGKFAFFMESTSLEYQIERNCELTQVGGLLDSKSYGVALTRNSRLRAPVSSAIIRLQESGVIAKLKRKWWREERGGGACAAEEKSATGGVRTHINP